MKRLLPLILAACLLIAGCGGNTAETTVPTTEAPVETTAVPTTEAPVETTVPPTTEAPTEAPTEPINPLTGETVDAPVTSRVFAVTINNVPAAMPHYGVSQADLYFELFINNYATRGLALYTDITEAEAVGSVRSLRFNFTDICQAFDAVISHAGGSEHVLDDLAETDVRNISVEAEIGDYYYRDEVRSTSGYAWEHCLFVRGPQLVKYAESKGIAVTQDPEKDYGLRFTENACPTDGETAGTINITMTLDGNSKKTAMVYDEATGMYVYNQFGYAMVDGYTNQPEAFKNVLVMMVEVDNLHVRSTIYHIADLVGEGDAYFACEGKLIPIKWHREGDTAPFTFTHTDGTPLELGVGSSHITLAPMESTISWE